MKQIMEKAMASHNVKEVKMAMSGQLDEFGNGKEKDELEKAGYRFKRFSPILISPEKAHLPYGDIGIKVWIYKEKSLRNNF